ncbi:MAG TPA: histidine triad nucleotide-binding protein [Thermodesulfobacteriota bacterium]
MTTAPADCIFCKIVRKEIPATVVHEDSRLLAFEDIRPQAPVHLLVIPKRHVTSLDDLTDADADLVGAIALLGARLARERGVAESGYRFLTNVNRDGGQVVFHLHFHVIGGRRLGPMA